jgi:hypothetical protein
VAFGAGSWPGEVWIGGGAGGVGVGEVVDCDRAGPMAAMAVITATAHVAAHPRRTAPPSLDS